MLTHTNLIKAHNNYYALGKQKVRSKLQLQSIGRQILYNYMVMY